MYQSLAIIADLAAIALLITLYVRRHRRRDLALAYACINVGVLAVTEVLVASTVGLGVGLGLFGVLSIIRLRSSEIAQHEVAYYFAALAAGLLAGFSRAGWLPLMLLALLVATMYVVDHPRFLRGYEHQTVVIDRALPDEVKRREYLADLLQATVLRVTVRRLDLVSDSTTVDVRYRTSASAPGDRSAGTDSLAPSVGTTGAVYGQQIPTTWGAKI